MSASPPLDPRTLGRLKWRCRRGLLENDLFIERFFRDHGPALSHRRAEGLEQLMALSDPELLDLLLARTEPDGVLDTAAVREVLGLMRRPPMPAAVAPAAVPASPFS